MMALWRVELRRADTAVVYVEAENEERAAQIALCEHVEDDWWETQPADVDCAEDVVDVVDLNPQLLVYEGDDEIINSESATTGTRTVKEWLSSEASRAADKLEPK